VQDPGPGTGDEALTATVVVPCFDEARRLDPSAFRAFAAPRPWLRFVFVDDGSRDATRAILEDLAGDPSGGFALVALERNRGKAEAVRAGMERVLAGSAHLVGFWDADLATPLAELDRFRAWFAADPALEIVLGSRVRLLGHRVERSAPRHYFGRIAATCVSQLLRLAVYDTQCGAKLFRATPAVREAFQAPFLTRWEFDVEILARWLGHHRARGSANPEARLREVPVQEWRDVAGSRLRARDFLRAPLELLRIWRAHPALRRPRRGSGEYSR
jgi:glycosyltransferase involved in cell wall biosynthesis